MEALQVSLQLYLKLCRVTFNNSEYSSTKERTGGKRYAKSLHFSTNIDLFYAIISNDNGEVINEGRKILWNWLIGEQDNETPLLAKLRNFLTSATEETQFKIRTNSESGNSEIYFQQEGIYESLLNQESVISKDFREDVGPFRILRSFVKSGLHSYLKETDEGFQSKVSNDYLKSYLEKVSTSLDIIPKRTVEIIEIENSIEATELNVLGSILRSYNKIYFGSPGTGKSTAIQRLVDEKSLACYRTTFHPDYDYGAFVGSYKPVSEGDTIKYRFVPQVFTNAYRHAWERPGETVVLIIEEINRGNCAQIFGDLFQSLDRDAAGYSSYDVDADADLAAFFAKSAEYGLALENLGQYQQSQDKSLLASKIILPPNLLLYATMNTSDQSLFPMDAAFKRRWDWEYVPIDYAQAAHNSVELGQGDTFNWGDFLSTINPKIKDLTRSEDKQVGNWFVRPSAGTSLIPYHQFRSKVMYYLWAEVCKDELDNSESLYHWTDQSGESRSFTYNDLYGGQEVEITAGFLRFHGIGLRPA